MMEAIAACPYILPEPAYGVVVGSWGDSSVKLASRPFCRSEHYWDAWFYLHEHIKKAFDQNGISIPLPQVDVHMKAAENGKTLAAVG
jgi:small conductance mechanosensitive channel